MANQNNTGKRIFDDLRYSKTTPVAGQVLKAPDTSGDVDWGNVGFSSFDTDLADTFTLVDGAYLDSPDVVVTSNGSTVTLSVEKDGGGDLRVLFSTGVYTWDTTPADTIALTAGTDTVPVLNYVYFLESTKALTVSTSSFPAAEYAPVAVVYCQSEASVQTDGPHKVHVWTDHLSNNNGHLAHINEWIRKQNATWVNGVALTPTITSNPGSEDNVDIATTSGVILQLHDHTFPAFNTGTGSSVFVVNKSGAAFTKITDLNAADQDTTGLSISNNKYTNLVIWGVVSEDTGDCKLYVNLPESFHSTSTAATLDAEKYSNYSIPSEFTGVGFLIARLTLKYTTAGSGTWELTENLDLRGQLPTVVAGGTAAAGNEFFDNNFKVLDDGDPTRVMQFECNGITTGTTRTLTVPNSSGTLYVTGGTDVSIADGGTGQSSKVPAFDALSPMTTKGDLCTYSLVGDRLAVGTSDGQQLIVDSSQSTGLKWQDVLSVDETAAAWAGAGPHTLYQFTTATDKAYMIKAYVVARRLSGTSGTAGDSLVYEITSRAKNVSGTVTLHDQTATFTSEDQAGADCILGVSGTKVAVLFTGPFADNVYTTFCNLKIWRI